MTITARAADVLAYWQDLGPEGWYAGGEALDGEIRQRFSADWHEAAGGGLRDWWSCPQGVLAYLLLTDQFPRNMFRGEAKAFATDDVARSAASRAWQHGMDLTIDGPIRQFFYLPMMHSESPFDQDRSVALFKCRMPDGGGSNLLHARAHREIIRKFRRFPFRNKALGRADTPAEAEFMAQGGYGTIVQRLGS